jgi:amidophosphoribosyltransferase
LVESVFTRENVADLTGQSALGHARYATIGRGDLGDVQPFVINYPFGIGAVHNGNLVNVDQLKKNLKTEHRRHLLTHSDSEIILNLLAQGLESARLDATEQLGFVDLLKSVGQVFDQAIGSYSIVSMIAGQGMVAFRDPHGIRPLVWGKRTDASGKEAHIFASESVVLGFLGYEKVRDLHPGEVVFVRDSGEVHTQVLKGQEHRPCMFEWIYFASPESEIDERPVYGARIALGRSLGQQVKRTLAERGITADIIVPVPETARIAAIALAEELEVPYREVLIKNRYIKRTFILDSQEKRQKAVNLKLSPVKSEITGKTVILVDDSIVRGTTSQKIIQLVRQAGASRVIFVSTCPPIQHPCFYGIDFPQAQELIAYGRDLAQIEAELGADAVIYQDISGLRQAIGLKKPCMACIDGNYPTDVQAGVELTDRRKQDRRS